MKRDGATKSLWQNEIQDYTTQNSITKEGVYDVVIVGGGITGVTTALLLQKQGKRCLIAEAHNLCFGTTGGTTSHLNTFLDTSYDQIISDFGEDDAQLVARATKDALGLFRKHIDEYKIDCGYETKDGYLYSQDEKQTDKLEKIFRASEKAGAEVEYIDKIPVPVPFEKAIVYKGQGQLHPAKYVYALAKEFENSGGVILQNCFVTNVTENDGILSIDTSAGNLSASKLIYATHIPPGVNLLHFRCAPYRSYAMAVKLKDGNYPDGLAYDMYDPYHYYRTQDINGEKFLIVGGEDHKTAHEENTDMCFTKLESHVRKYYNVEEVSFKWSSQYFEPADGLAYIGTLPGGGDNVYVATGYSGNGITYSHIAAIILTDLITNGQSDYAELFDPNRVKMVAGFASFVKENADVVKEFFGKRLQKEKIKELSEIASGEAKRVKYDGKSIALYKDEAGHLHAINPVCPHAKCVVGWNSAEKSWDCPCHGSRFSFDGELLTGPSKHGLEKIELDDLARD